MSRPDGELLADRAPGIARRDLAGGERADGDGERLGAGVAAHAGDHRHQGGERDQPRDRALELGDDEGAEQRGEQVDAQPGQAAQAGLQRRDVGVVLADAAELEDVVLGLLVDHVDHVVDGDHAEQPAVAVDHRGGDQGVAAEGARHLLLVGLGREGAQLLVA